jgi:hypothetical protein
MKRYESVSWIYASDASLGVVVHQQQEFVPFHSPAVAVAQKKRAVPYMRRGERKLWTVERT